MAKSVHAQINNFLISFLAGTVAVLVVMQVMGSGDVSVPQAVVNPDLIQSNVLAELPAGVATQVSIEPKDSMAGAGESIDLKVTLLDANSRPVVGHKLQLIASSASSKVFTDSDISSKAGEVLFKVTSSEEGKVSYSVYDVTSGQTLEARSNVVFFDSYDDVFDSKFASSPDSVSVGKSSGAVDYLKFEDVGDVTVGGSFDFTLSAYDELDQLVTDYDSEVRFSVTSGEASYASLPSDYQFRADDLGQHTFSLATTFQKAGIYVVEARDMDNTNIYGSYDFVVAEGAGSLNTNDSGISVSNPLAGTYSNAVQVVSGTAPIGANLKIYDNNVEIGSVFADVNGAFSFTTRSLVDGNHVIYVAMVNDVGTIVAASPSVNIKVDTSAPDLGELRIEPSSGVTVSSPVTVKYFTGEALNEASIIVDGSLYEMIDSGQGYYEASFISPDVEGSFPVSIVVVDQLGNESKYEDEAQLIVGQAVFGLADVKGLIVTSAQNRIVLNWDAVDKASRYRVYYGRSPSDLADAVDTFTNATTWYIPNLENGIEYYFAVVAVSDSGEISARFSNIVSAVPGGVVNVDLAVDMGSAGADELSDLDGDVSDTGPGVLLLIVFAALAGYFYTKSSKLREL